jgi:Ca-dependent carbohydrate-binding module xylan-binding/Cellulase (glycosyl hydrolase family 5)
MANFTVSATGGFINPNEQQWAMRGLNAGVQDALTGFANVLTDYPGLTAIRLNTGGNDSATDIDKVVQEYTARGVVVMIEDHSGNPNNVAWYTQMATAYKGNANVFLEMPNEPNATNLAQIQIGLVNAIRAAGFTNPIALQPAGGYDFSNISAVTAAVGTNNIFITPHIYFGGADPNGAAQYVSNDISTSLSLGLFPAIDEFGDAMDGWNRDQYGDRVISSVIAANDAGKAGAVFWAMDNGNHPNGADSAFLNTSGTQLTPVGRDIQPWLSQSTTTTGGGTNPPVTPSPDGTKISSATASPIIDQVGNALTLAQSASNGLQIAVNGTPAPITTGSGSDTLVLGVSEDAYQGDAQFTVSVDGKQLGGTFTTTASHAAGVSQSLTVNGDWASGAHTVAVNYLNDAFAGSGAADRNLYVDAVGYDGAATGQSGILLGNGPRNFGVTDSTAVSGATPIQTSPVTPPVSAPATPGSGPDTLVLDMSEDAYKGDAQFTVSVDGQQLGGTFTTTALHTSGARQSFTFKGNFGSGQHDVAVKFLNDAWRGTAATDRNLYVNGISYDGTATGQTAALYGTGPVTFPISDAATTSVGEETFVLSNGDAASVTLGTGASRLSFVGTGSVTLTGGSGQAVVTADAGSKRFVAGPGTLDVTGGGGKDAYVFHANGGLLRIEDFSSAKGDTLTVDKALQGSMQQASDGQGGTMLTFGAGANHGVDIRGLAALPASNVLWV